MKGAAPDGSDIGANAWVRHVDGLATTQPLWDTTTGAFPCGAVVQGINDTATLCCANVHARTEPLACL